jgi:hypothetical protein
MQYRKLFDRNPMYHVFCDKLAGRAYAEAAGCGLKFPKLYWSGADPAAIPFEDLSFPYMVKASHRCGANYAVRGPDQADPVKIRSLCRRWLRSHYGQRFGEWGYRDIPRRILIEELLRAPNGALFPDDYKFFTLSGRVEWIEHIHDRGQKHFKTYFDRDWRRIKARRWRGDEGTLRAFLEDAPRPATLERMIEISEALARGTDQLRVDLYAIGTDIFFGEFTPYEESGMGVVYPEEESFTDFPSADLDREIGRLWHLQPMPVSAKLACALLGKSPNVEHTDLSRTAPEA